jgi:hypothetical protein
VGIIREDDIMVFITGRNEDMIQNQLYVMTSEL